MSEEHEVSANEPLIVQSGENRTISARLLQYPGLRVEKGGTLTIRPNSTRWCILWISGDVVIEGRIVGKQFVRAAEPIVDSTPDGKTLEHKFRHLATGGRGGSGGIATLPGAGTRSGGAGALGSDEFGGGGGSGGGIHIMGHATRLGANGLPAVGWSGGPLTDGGYENRGGDGGGNAVFINGALLMIYCQHTFGGKGMIDLTAEAGQDGTAGGDGVESNRGLRGAGGGGGGAPGGEGGRFVCVASTYTDEPEVVVDGGPGGKPGPPGRFPNSATAGLRGNPGASGYLDIRTMTQWQQSAGLVLPT